MKKKRFHQLDNYCQTTFCIQEKTK